MIDKIKLFAFTSNKMGADCCTAGDKKKEPAYKRVLEPVRTH